MVQTVFTLNLYIISRAVRVSRTLLALSQITWAFAGLITSSMPPKKTAVKTESNVKAFMDGDFLLDTETAKILYHDDQIN